MRRAPAAWLWGVALPLLGAAPASCAGSADEAPTGAAAVPASAPRAGLLTKGGKYRVDWAPTPDPIPLSTLFTVEVRVVDAATGAPETTATVKVDATMPQHGHGMPTRPEVDPGLCAGEGAPCVHPDGRYLVRGMKMHMQGDWVLAVDVDGSRGPDRLETPVGL